MNEGGQIDFELYEALADVERWCAKMTPLPRSESNDDFMTFGVELMVKALTLLRFAAAIGADDESVQRGVPQEKAMIMGLFIRMTKLYHGLLMHVSEAQRELGAIFVRLLFETETKLRHFMSASSSSFRSFVQISYKPERDVLKDLKKKRSTRPLSPIERRMISSVLSHMREDRIGPKWLSKNKTWDLDGKNYRALLASLGSADERYAYGFGMGSHIVHGDWFDIKMYHVDKDGKFFHPKLKYTTPDLRDVCPVTAFCLVTAVRCLEWTGGDPDDFVRPIIRRVLKVSQALDDAHEAYVQREG